MTKPDAVKDIDRKIMDNNRVFLLMIGYGKVNLFRYLNREFDKLVKQKNQVTRFLEGK